MLAICENNIIDDSIASSFIPLPKVGLSRRSPTGYEPRKYSQIKKPVALTGEFLLRRVGSNHRPSGYEPDELPLLYLALQI